MLDNPIWHSLRTRHAHLERPAGIARRYPPQVTPFVAVREASSQGARDLETLLEPGEHVGILSVIPPMRWKIIKEIEIRQYVWPTEATANLDAGAVRLDDTHLDAMLELTALVYPAYFRAGTAHLGDYYGIFEDGRLAAMAGIRMSMDGFQELSAICTHPDYRGRGFAGRLTRHLAHQVTAQGDIAFLHTESDNPAQGMYEKLGFRLRATMPFHVALVS